MREDLRVAYNFAAGGVAGMVARTVIAPVERIKIIYQTRTLQCSRQGWSVLVRHVMEEGGGGWRGMSSFWRGNMVAVVRVFPYLGVQMAANEHYKAALARLGHRLPLRSEVQHFAAGGGAGMTAVFTTYPLDLARARMALLIEQGAELRPTFLGTMRKVVAKEGSVFALYAGIGVSLGGAALYCGTKFATYDMSKGLCQRYLLPDPDGPPSALHRAASGGFAGVMANTFVYPFDVLRRRLQTGGPDARAKYPGVARGLWTLYREEGFLGGLYRGVSLNYIKTVPNTTVYLALFDLMGDMVR